MQSTIEENSVLYEHHRIIVDAGQTPERVDKFLFNRIVNVSRNKIQNAARAGNILINDIPAKPNKKIKPYDVISVVLSHPPRDITIYPEDINIEIVYEDNDVIVVNKPAGMVVHPAHANYNGTLLNALAWYFKKAGNNDVENGFGYLVHRIDKDTSGLLLVAKNELAQSILARQFFEHTIKRQYFAMVWGDFDKDEETITGNIGRHPKDRRKMKVFPDGEYGKPAITHYKIIQRFGYVSLVECHLETGRTHQIRVHFQHIGHPLFNDAKYGGNQILKGTTFTKYKQFVQNCFKIMPRQALHARSLGFIHPISEKDMFFDSQLPDDMQLLIDKWDNYTGHRDIE